MLHAVLVVWASCSIEERVANIWRVETKSVLNFFQRQAANWSELEQCKTNNARPNSYGFHRFLTDQLSALECVP